MKTKHFSELRKRMTPERRVESEIPAKITPTLLSLISGRLQKSLEVPQQYLKKI